MTQNARLLNWLETHQNGLTQLEAFNALGCCRLSERIRELKRLGYLIEHSPEKTANGARVMRYRLVGTYKKHELGIEFKPYPHKRLIYNSEINDPTTWDATPMEAA